MDIQNQQTKIAKLKAEQALIEQNIKAKKRAAAFQEQQENDSADDEDDD